MRDLAVLTAFVLALPWALRFTWAAVLLWTWISVMNPHRLTFGVAQSLPLAAIAAGAALLSLLVNPARWRALQQPLVAVLLLLLVWMGVSTVFALDPAASWRQFSKVLKIEFMVLLAMVALQEKRHIEWFVWANVLSIGFYGFKGGLFTLATGGENRVWGPPGGFIEGNNEIALALVMTLPLMNYLRLQSRARWLRAALLGLMGLSVVAAVGSQSRGAFLALLAMGTMLWLRSHSKLLTGLVLLLLSFTVLAFMPESWEDRMRTIQSYDTDNSALGRINAWWTCLHIANDRLTGGGFEIYTPGVFERYAPDPENVKAAHSIYFSVLGEHGYIGLALFLLLWLVALRLSRQIRTQARAHQPAQSWAHDLAAMCQVSLAGYAMGGAFLSLAYFDLPYNMLVMLVATRCWQQDQSGAAAASAPGPAMPALRSSTVAGRRP